jgi:hypothetical protein
MNNQVTDQRESLFFDEGYLAKFYGALAYHSSGMNRCFHRSKLMK